MALIDWNSALGVKKTGLSEARDRVTRASLVPLFVHSSTTLRPQRNQSHPIYRPSAIHVSSLDLTQ